MMKPNGICFSPDEKKLYIVDTGPTAEPGVPHPIRVYDVEGRKGLKNGRLFADMSPGSSDGIRCDVDGNVWSAADALSLTSLETEAIWTVRPRDSGHGRLIECNADITSGVMTTA